MPTIARRRVSKGKYVTVPSTRSQTLDRGLRILEIIATSDTRLSITQLSEISGLHRSIVYRLLRTLEDHRLVARDRLDRFGPGVGLASLASNVARDLARLAAPALQGLADTTGLCACLVVREGDEAATMLVADPRGAPVDAPATVGFRHSILLGAPGHALRSLDGGDDHPEVRRIRSQGWATSRGEVLNGVTAVAAPLAGYRVPAAVVVSFHGARELEPIAAQVKATAGDIAEHLATT